MKFMKSSVVVLALAAALGGCTRIETGEVGVRLNASKEVEGKELLPGSWNQTLIGTVLEFPVRDIVIDIENKTPLTADNSALADFDVSVVYSINPGSVAELYSAKSKTSGFHAAGEEGIYLMYNYITTLVNNASYKAVRKYRSLEVADNRAEIEEQIRASVNEQLRAEKLDTAITVNVVQVRNVAPNAEILRSATEYVRSQNELKIKENEVKLAKLEAERMAALAQNSGQSIQYMQAQAQMKIAEGIAAGRVQTIVVPVDFRGMVNVGKWLVSSFIDSMKPVPVLTNGAYTTYRVSATVGSTITLRNTVASAMPHQEALLDMAEEIRKQAAVEVFGEYKEDLKLVMRRTLLNGDSISANRISNILHSMFGDQHI